MRTEIEVDHALHGKIQSKELLTCWTRRRLSQGNGKETVGKYIVFDIVTEWTRVLCCSSLAQREVGREKTAAFGSFFSDHFYFLVLCRD